MATQQSTSATCIPCTTCTLGGFETTQCSASANRVCAVCTNKPQRASFLTASSACTWVCDSGYYGNTCAACVAGFWCISGIANKCPTASTSSAMSATQNACVCQPGYSSQGIIPGTSPCVLCQSGSVCPGTGIVSAEIQSTPIPNVTSQIILVQQPLPLSANLVSLFAGVPAWIRAMRLLISSTIPLFTRQICRGSFCTVCDGTDQCVTRIGVAVTRGLDGKYSFNITRLTADVLYEFTVLTPGMCVPTFGIDPEYVTGTKVAIASISTISSVSVVCLTDSLATTSIPVVGTAYARRRANRRLLQQTSDTLSVGIIVPANQTTVVQSAVVSAGIDVVGYTPVSTAIATAPALSCPINSTSPEGSTSIGQCVCLPGYKGNAAAGTPCSPCPPNTFCSGGLLGLCAANALAPSMSSSANDCACVAGFYGNPSSCQQCPANSFCPGGLTATTCTANAVSPVQSTSQDACYCVAGYGGIKNTPCTLCTPGSWCWTGVANTCPSNSMTSPGASSADQCSCVDGYRTQSSTDDHGIVTKTCLQCSSNTYCKVRPHTKFVYNTPTRAYVTNASITRFDVCGSVGVHF